MDPPSRRDALALLYERHYAELVRLAFALTSDWDLAEELAQDAFVRVWRSWGNIRDQQSAPAYLRTTVVNLAAAACAAGCKNAGPGATPVISDQLTPTRASTCCRR